MEWIKSGIIYFIIILNFSIKNSVVYLILYLVNKFYSLVINFSIVSTINFIQIFCLVKLYVVLLW